MNKLNVPHLIKQVQFFQHLVKVAQQEDEYDNELVAQREAYDKHVQVRDFTNWSDLTILDLTKNL